ncbi:MAG: hypothetical protein QXT31_01515 [Candidatus Bathyarchaeia archaeon]
MNELNSRKDLIEFFLSEPHSLYLIVLFLVRKLTNLSSLFIIKASPALLTTFLIITVYSLVKTGTKNEYLGTLSSAFACFSYYTTVGMFSGIFANWLALSELILFISIFLIAIEKSSKKYLLIAILVYMLVLFTHPWTWEILIVIVGLFFIISIFNFVKRKKENIDLFFTLSILIISILIISLMFFSKINLIMFNEFLLSYQEIMPFISYSYLLKLNKTLTWTLIGYVGGFLMNPIMFILAILGLFSIRNLKNEFNRMPFSWITATSIGALLVSSWFQWRLFYLMPLPILATLGVHIRVY